MRAAHRIATPLAILVLAGLAGAVPAQADTSRLGESVAMTGKAYSLGATGRAAASQSFTGRLTIERFTARGGKLYAIGKLRFSAGDRKYTRTVRVPARLASTPTARASQVTEPIPPTQNACQILSLVLGPIDINLLGLRIRTNQIRVLIEAVPTGVDTGGVPGGLLGDLLCAIANLLNPEAELPASQVARVLNAVLALAGPQTVAAGTR